MEYWINIFENKSLVTSMTDDPHTSLDEAIDHVWDYNETPWTYCNTIHHKDGVVELMDLLPLIDELNETRRLDRAHDRAVLAELEASR